MDNYDEWVFTFSEDISSRGFGISSVPPFFKNLELYKIRQDHFEADIVY